MLSVCTLIDDKNEEISARAIRQSLLKKNVFIKLDNALIINTLKL